MKEIILILLATVLYSKVTILEIVNLSDIEFDRLPFNEISGATYDSNRSKLYMISDNGILYEFNATFDSKVHLKPIKANYLKDENGTVLDKIDRDSEDIALNDNGELFISFERIPKIAQFSKNGRLIKKLDLPEKLQDIQYRTNNKMYESLTFNKKYGLLTALENPPYGVKRSNQTIYALNNKSWKYSTTCKKRSSIVAIESIDESNILVLERAFDGLFGHHAISLQKLNLESGEQVLIWQFDDYKGNRIENYEALAKVGEDRYIIISDDNKIALFDTYLIYFRVEP